MINYSEIRKQWNKANRSWIEKCEEEGDYESVDMEWEHSNAYADYVDAMAIVNDRFFGFGTEDEDVDNEFSIDIVEQMYDPDNGFIGGIGSDRFSQEYAWEKFLAEMGE